MDCVLKVLGRCREVVAICKDYGLLEVKFAITKRRTISKRPLKQPF